MRPRITIHTEKLGTNEDNFVEINGERIKVRGLDMKIRAGEEISITLYLMPHDLNADMALLPGARVWLADWEYLHRKGNVEAAEKELLHRMRLYLSVPLDDALMYWRVSAEYHKDGSRYGIRTRWHTDAKMTAADLVKVFTILKDRFVVLDKRALFFPSGGADHLIYDGALFEQVDEMEPRKITELPSSKEV